MRRVSKQSLMSRRFFLKHVIDDATRLHFRIFPERNSATEELFGSNWFGPLAIARCTFLSLSKNSFLTFVILILSIFRHISLPVA